MIPKSIHYCWFGGKEKTALAKKCIASWKKTMPDFSITEWNESNFDVHTCPYAQDRLRCEDWAHLSDYARLKIIHDSGGIYFDTDVETLRSFEPILKTPFIGFEGRDYVNTGLGFGAEKGNAIVQEMMKAYEGDNPPEGNCPAVNTEVLLRHGLKRNGMTQTVDGMTVYANDFFNPLDDATGVLTVTENTHSIHHYAKSWMPMRSVVRNRASRILHRLLGTDFFRKKRKRV